MATSDPVLTSILAVVVIYKRPAADASSLHTLMKAAAVADSSLLRLSIMMADNTPGGQDPGSLPAGVDYRAYPDNPGLARPYNDAVARAEESGFTWLLTLDQDTHLPASFLTAVNAYARRFANDDRVAAVVPRIMDQGRQVSPLRYVGGFLPQVLTANANGISGRHTSALNSASLLRVSALRQIGGYNLRFPLHHSDTDLYQRLDKAGKRVVVAPDIVVAHELAIMDRQRRMTADRYRAALADERAFWDVNMGFLGRAERMVRLLGRVCKQTIQREDPELRAVSVEEIRLRLLTRRRRRMETWRKTLLG